MPFVPTPGIVQANLFHISDQGIFAQNRLYFAASSVPTTTDLEEIDDALYDVYVAQVVNEMSGFWSLTGISYRAMNEEEGIQLVSAQAFPQQGGAGDTEPEANQVCYTVTLNTGLVGRSARGRIYGIGITNGASDGSRLYPASQATYQANWEGVRSAMETAGHAMQVVSFFEGGVPRAEGRPLPVLSVSVRFPIATQRRRLS